MTVRFAPTIGFSDLHIRHKVEENCFEIEEGLKYEGKKCSEQINILRYINRVRRTFFKK